MAENITDLTTSTFDTSIASGTWLVDFWASWCGPCRMQGKIIEGGAADLAAAGAKIGKVNIDDEAALAMRFNVLSIPTLIIFKDGQKVQEFVGVQQLDALKDALK